ncbi:MAG: hypothetical protein II699_08130, partial [Lachnospiraceae bacterium]|nr:hypothetical protein [Lachnospiraceae bacterium]
FGNEVARTGTTENSYGYRGEEQDETGLYYLRARYMDPSTGTFTTMDTYAGRLSDPMSLHKYMYANSNPVKYIDPSGHVTLGEVMASMAIMTVLSAATNALIAGFLYSESVDISDFSWGEMFKEMGLAFLGGIIVGGMAMLATFLVFALALTALECILCMWICCILGILVGFIADDFFSDNEIVNRILHYFSQGFFAAECSFGFAGIAGGANGWEAEGGIGAGGSGSENEVFYRTMSESDYEYLQSTGRVRATSETFISPTESYALQYDGVTVRFEVAPGTTEQLYNIGVSNNTSQVIADYGQMPNVSSGWTSNCAFFKGEGEQTNIGLGRGTALDIFNNNICSYSVVG